MFGDIQLNVVGDSAYVAGTPQFNSNTKLFDCGANFADNLHGLPKRASIHGAGSRNSQRNMSKVRVVIERTFGYCNNTFKFLKTKDRQKAYGTFVNRENVTTSVLVNLRSIMYNSACSNALSDVLPSDFYLQMWGTLKN